MLLNRLRPLTHLIIINNQPLILNLLKIFNSTFAAICKLLAHFFIPFMQTLFIAFILIYKFQLVLFKLLLNNIFAQVIKQFSQLVRLDSNERVLLLCENIDFNRGFLRSQSVEFINKRSIFSYKLAQRVDNQDLSLTIFKKLLQIQIIVLYRFFIDKFSCLKHSIDRIVYIVTFVQNNFRHVIQIFKVFFTVF